MRNCLVLLLTTYYVLISTRAVRAANTVVVNNLSDSAPGDPRNCQVIGEQKCTLRSAWSYCKEDAVKTDCEILLPSTSVISFNSTLGQFSTTKDQVISISGQGSKIFVNNSIDMGVSRFIFSSGSKIKYFEISIISTHQITHQVGLFQRFRRVFRYRILHYPTLGTVHFREI